jgi:hypothetical protein
MRRSLSVAVGLLLVLAGCTPRSYPVSGTVTWKGEPLPEGDIVFIDRERSEVQDHGKIVNGQIQAQVKPGKKRVLILASKESGKFDPNMGAAPRVQYIPTQYNDPYRSILEADVTPNGANSFTFDLKEKP